jgi:hypothetical protein
MRRHRELIVVAASGNDAGSESKGNNMLKKLIGAAAVAAATCAFVPAQAAYVGLACSDDNLAKTEGATEAMPYVPGKIVAQREMAAAQTALLADNWRQCAMHLANAAQATSMGQTQYASPYVNTFAQSPAPYQQGPYQSQWGWGPGQGGWGPGPGPQ